MFLVVWASVVDSAVVPTASKDQGEWLPISNHSTGLLEKQPGWKFRVV